jgi:hypothetical protein
MARLGRATPASPRGRVTRLHWRLWRCWMVRRRGLSRKAVELALDGDTTALRLCLERIAPPRKDAPVTFDLPSMQTAADAAKAAGAVLNAVAEGDLTPTEGAHIMALVETYRRTLETSSLEARVLALEDDSHA